MGGGPDQGRPRHRRVGRVGFRARRRAAGHAPAQHVAATLFKGLGLDPHRELPGPQNRPLPLADFNVQPIKELF